MKKRVIVISIVAVSIFVVGFMIFKNTPNKVHYHAGFLVYVDGVREDFSDPKYDKISPCTAPGAKINEDAQLEKAHLHDKIGDVVHVESAGAVWGDLFKNIHYAFNKNTPVHGFINGTEIPNILTYPINAYDSVIFVVGSTSGVDLTKTVTKAHIIEVEKKGDSCGV
jgi:hypothetical protein